MGLFDFFKRRREKRYNERMDRIFAEYAETQMESPSNITHRLSTPDDVQHMVFDKCEKIIDYSHQLEEAKIEYDKVTSYIMDIDIIEDLPPDPKAEIKSLAERIVLLKQDRKDYQAYSEQLADERFDGVRRFEDEFPAEIDKLKENERFRGVVKRDMDFLQGEKNAIIMQIDDAYDYNKKLKTGAMILPFVLAFVLCALFVFKAQFKWDITMPLCIAVGIAAVIACAIFLVMQKNNELLTREHNNLNYIIVILNRMKTKYVGVTIAVEHAYKRFNINSAYELEFLWKEYDGLKKERAKHGRTTDDLEYYSSKMSYALARFNINNPELWPGKVEAILDPREMVEIRHNLNNRRQKLRARIEASASDVNQVKEEISSLILDNPQYSDELLDMVKSIDSKLSI